MTHLVYISPNHLKSSPSTTLPLPTCTILKKNHTSEPRYENYRQDVRILNFCARTNEYDGSSPREQHKDAVNCSKVYTSSDNDSYPYLQLGVESIGASLQQTRKMGKQLDWNFFFYVIFIIRLLHFFHTFAHICAMSCILT